MTTEGTSGKAQRGGRRSTNIKSTTTDEQVDQSRPAMHNHVAGEAAATRPKHVAEKPEPGVEDLDRASVRLRQVPTDLLRRMIAYRVREHEDESVLWM
ncbi:hypothetical protein [Krasilnikovia sp. M28-CT-15]|uniref:hypothetical protein n=1 Tax=Krasilnikovia sp. M28-CT-15 TaxID=3373540 RepID=UPI00399CCB77